MKKIEEKNVGVRKKIGFSVTEGGAQSLADMSAKKIINDAFPKPRNSLVFFLRVAEKLGDFL